MTNEQLKILVVFLNIFGVYIFLRKEKKSRAKIGAVANLKRSLYGTNSKKSGITDKLKKLPVISYINKLLDAQAFEGEYTKDFFVFLLIAIFGGVYITGGAYAFQERVFYASAMTAVPLLILSLRLRKGQSKGSLEAEALISELSAHYKISKNLLSAIDATIVHCESIDITRKHLFKLSMQIKEYKSIQELDTALKEFQFAIGTLWSKKLSQIIYSDIIDGIDQTEALNNLIQDLEYGRKLYEEYKRANSEAVTVIKFIVPLIYVVGFIGSIKVFQMSFREIMINQFTDPVGLKLFIFIIITYSINLISLYTIQHKKLDTIS